MGLGSKLRKAVKQVARPAEKVISRAAQSFEEKVTRPQFQAVEKAAGKFEEKVTRPQFQGLRQAGEETEQHLVRPQVQAPGKAGQALKQFGATATKAAKEAGERLAASVRKSFQLTPEGDLREVEEFLPEAERAPTVIVTGEGDRGGASTAVVVAVVVAALVVVVVVAARGGRGR